MTPMKRRSLEKFLLLWSLFFVLYLLFAASLETVEVVTGAICGGAMSLLFLALKRKLRRLFQIKPAWLFPLLQIPWAMFQESWLLTLALLRRLAGRQSEGRTLEGSLAAAKDDYAPARRA